MLSQRPMFNIRSEWHSDVSFVFWGVRQVDVVVEQTLTFCFDFCACCAGNVVLCHRCKSAHMLSVIDFGVTDDNVLCAALLHDTLEDTVATEQSITEKFGARVTQIVKQLTSDNSKIVQLGKEQYEKWIAATDQEERAKETTVNVETASIAQQLKQWMPSEMIAKDGGSLLRKRMGKALYLTRKLNEMDLDALAVKLSDRIDNLIDIEDPPTTNDARVEDSVFLIGYYVESKYMLDHLDCSRFQMDNSVHHKLVKELDRVLQERLHQIQHVVTVGCPQPQL